MNEIELRQMFKNRSDCYADTWLDIGIEMQQGEVIQAMTEDRFIETLREAKLLAAPAVSKCEGIERRVLLLAFLTKYIQVRDSQKPNAMDIEILDNFLRQQ